MPRLRSRQLTRSDCDAACMPCRRICAATSKLPLHSLPHGFWLGRRLVAATLPVQPVLCLRAPGD